jgi:hypothetical protein
MRENMMFCSALSDKIDYLTKKAIEFENKMDKSESTKELNLNYNIMMDIESERKYQQSIYKHQCSMYDLFCKNLFK